jgi:hypothetical protein
MVKSKRNASGIESTSNNENLKSGDIPSTKLAIIELA